LVIAAVGVLAAAGMEGGVLGLAELLELVVDEPELEGLGGGTAASHVARALYSGLPSVASPSRVVD
jgi:hypothetical protein